TRHKRGRLAFIVSYVSLKTPTWSCLPAFGLPLWSFSPFYAHPSWYLSLWLYRYVWLRRRYLCPLASSRGPHLGLRLLGLPAPGLTQDRRQRRWNRLL